MPDIKKDKVFSVAMTKCYYCGESSDIIINTTLTAVHAKAVASMDGTVVNMNPCMKCKEYMDMGIIVITIDPSKSTPGWEHERIPNPHRTGGFFVITQKAIEDIIIDKDLLEWVKSSRWMFMNHDSAIKIGLFKYADKTKETKSSELPPTPPIQ